MTLLKYKIYQLLMHLYLIRTQSMDKESFYKKFTNYITSCQLHVIFNANFLLSFSLINLQYYF